MGTANHGLRRAAQQDVGDGPARVRANDDEIGIPFLRGRNNLLLGIAFLQNEAGTERLGDACFGIFQSFLAFMEAILTA